MPVLTEHHRRVGVRREAASPFFHSQAPAGSLSPRRQLPSLRPIWGGDLHNPNAISLQPRAVACRCAGRASIILLRQSCRTDDPAALTRVRIEGAQHCNSFVVVATHSSNITTVTCVTYLRLCWPRLFVDVDIIQTLPTSMRASPNTRRCRSRLR